MISILRISISVKVPIDRLVVRDQMPNGHRKYADLNGETHLLHVERAFLNFLGSGVHIQLNTCRTEERYVPSGALGKCGVDTMGLADPFLQAEEIPYTRHPEERLIRILYVTMRLYACSREEWNSPRHDG